MTESALLRALEARPLLEGRSRVYRKLVIVLLALIISYWNIMSGRLEQTTDLLLHFANLLNCDSTGILCFSIPGLLSSVSSIKLEPYYIVGFVDGEGCFYVVISKDANRKTG